MNYSTIKQLAKENGLKISDLVALAPNNDPFYTGRDSEMIAAEWFVGLWQRFGYRQGVHLRRMHYQVVSQKPPIARPDGQVYENSEKDWAYLNNAGKWARYLDLVSPDAFVDRRNPEAIINTRWRTPSSWDWQDPTPKYKVYKDDEFYEYSLPKLPELDDLPERLPYPPSFEVDGYDGIQQDFHIETWCEKTTMNDVLEPVCRRYNVNLVLGAGEMSITAVVDFLERVVASSERPARILYISDYDPAGLGMPVSVARKIEFFQRNDTRYQGLDIRLQPIILSSEQVQSYDLPRVPVKSSDKRKAKWEASHGKGQVELDALEAIYPGELAEIVTQAILGYWDTTLNERSSQAKQAFMNTLDNNREEVIARYDSKLRDISHEYSMLLADFRQTQDDFDKLVSDFRPKIDAYKSRLDRILGEVDAVNGEIYSHLDQIYIDTSKGEYRLPEPRLPLENDHDLYISTRDYFSQIEAYNQHRNGKADV